MIKRSNECEANERTSEVLIFFYFGALFGKRNASIEAQARQKCKKKLFENDQKIFKSIVGAAKLETLSRLLLATHLFIQPNDRST